MLRYTKFQKDLNKRNVLKFNNIRRKTKKHYHSPKLQKKGSKKMYTKLNGSKYQIDCKVWKPENIERIIIAIHGFAGDKESKAINNLANEMLKDNTLTVALDLPGHGTSKVNGDSLTLENCLEDIQVVENTYKQKYPNVEIDYFATSFGAYLLLLKLAKKPRKTNKIVLRCPAICMDKIFKNAILKEPFYLFKQRGYTIVGYVRKLKINFSFYKELEENQIFHEYQEKNNQILIIHGDQDNMAPIEDSFRFHKEYDTKMIVIKGADHRFKKEGELEKVVQYAKDFYLNNNNPNNQI